MNSALYYSKRAYAIAGFSVKPSVFILGAQKAGTTTLHSQLSRHPKLHAGLRKELRYFSETKYYDKGMRWYKSFFPYKGNGYYLDATPEYLYYPKAAERIHKFNPNSKLIITLRNPINRAFSAWNMYQQFGEIESSFNTNFLEELKINNPNLYERFYENGFPSFSTVITRAIDSIEEKGYDDFGVLGRGLYYNQITNYLKYFSLEDILIIEFEDLKSDTLSTIKKIYEFIGLDFNTTKIKKQIERKNKRSYRNKINPKDQERLKDFFCCENRKLYALLDQDFGW